MSTDRLSAAAMADYTSSFTEYLSVAAPHLLPSAQKLQGVIDAPHGTTIVALATSEGIVMAGDRRATMGNVIAQRDIEKVFQADEYSVIGIAGTAGVAIEMVRLLQVELEHYEKLEGTSLSLDGKANRLAVMIRGNLGMAMQGLAVVPLFGGYDLDRKYGRIYSYDVTGGRYEEHSGFHAVGSGSVYARSAMKKRYRAGISNAEGVQVAIEALYDAADDDSATGGPDLTRNIFPVVTTVDHNGVVILEESAVGAIAREVVASRNENPGG